MALKTSVKELKAKEISKVEEISWNISNRIREFGNASMYGGFCLAYVAYVSLKNKITDINQLKEYVELTFSPERVSFIKENIGNLWNVAIEISEEYSEAALLATVLWWQLQGNRFMGECETPQSVIKLANEILQISNDKVADYCSGIGSFLVSAIEKSPESQFYGTEIVRDVKEVSAIRTELISDRVKIEQKSVLNIKDNLMFDKIFCDYPWGIKAKDSIGSNEALQAAEKGLERLTEAVKGLERITPATQTTGIEGVKDLRGKCYTAMNDDLNSPIVIAHLFDGARMINTVLDKKATISAEDLEELKSMFHLFMYEILGLKEEAANNEAREEAYGKVVDMLLEQRMKAKANKDWATSDEIRNTLTALGFEIKDTKDGFEWRLNK